MSIMRVGRSRVAFLQDAAMCYHVGGIARHIQAIEVRADGAEPFRQFPAVHLRHHHVGDQQVNIFRMFLGKMYGVYRSMRCKDRAAQIFELILARFRIATSSSTSRMV